MTKYVQIFIDDFTSNSLSYDNVEIYDFGLYSDITYFDDYYYDWYYDPYLALDIGDIDETILNYSFADYFHVDDFYELTPYNYGTSEPSWTGYNSYYDVYQYESYSDFLSATELLPHESSAFDVGHGDWVLDAFMNQLDDSSNVEVLAIDIDFTTFEDFSYLFQDQSAEVGIQSAFWTIFNDFIWGLADPANTLISGLSASLTSGSQIFAESIQELIDLDLIFTQSAANATSSGSSYGDAIPNVITVGAWNVDYDGDWLGSSFDDFLEIDIYADGYVEHEGWGGGWNFGTSFATPRVAAEIINFFDEFLTNFDFSLKCF